MTKQYEQRYKSGKDKVSVVSTMITYMEQSMGYGEGVAKCPHHISSYLNNQVL